MGSGFLEIGLVLFTTLAPAGAIAFALVALRALAVGSRAQELRDASHCLIIPLSIAILGLVASATQLGTPANALNVFRHLGTSPLSNEVFWSVLFLLLAGVYWQTTFYRAVPFAVARVWLGATAVAALLMVRGISLAYGMYTIPLWNTPYVPLNLWCAGLFGGSLLAIVTLTLCNPGCPRMWHRVLIAIAIACAALVLETVSCVLQNAALQDVGNAVVRASDLVPAYPVMIAAFALCGAVSIIGFARLGASERPKRTAPLLLYSLVAFAGLFSVRLAFYGLHMTLGF